MKTPYNTMQRDCNKLHKFSNKDIKKFIKIANIKKYDKILDAMSGNGVIAKKLSKKRKIELHVLDNSEFQIKLAKRNIKNADFHIASVLKMPFNNNFFNKVFIRNGIYEIPKNQQLNLCKEIHRILKPNGLFINWTFSLNNKNKRFFNDLVRKKDKISEFKDLVKNRYFLSKEEFIDYLKKAGFKNIKFYDLKIFYTLSTKNWFKYDFNSDPKKLKEWNDFIKKEIIETELPNMSIKYFKGNFQLKIPALISVAEKII